MRPSMQPRVPRSMIAPRKTMLRQLRKPTQRCPGGICSSSRSNQNVAPVASITKGCVRIALHVLEAQRIDHLRALHSAPARSDNPPAESAPRPRRSRTPSSPSASRSLPRSRCASFSASVNCGPAGASKLNRRVDGRRRLRFQNHALMRRELSDVNDQGRKHNGEAGAVVSSEADGSFLSLCPTIAHAAISLPSASTRRPAPLP